ncbi:NAD-dependent epimerase/dehydratase [Thermodesulfatator indicus DSM 15286]|uniref:NAD-dependent epimerase/dehydratase n=1 Tax=Thermodesulfatator indicus (strain DSM 15286 / JCM 11887 / CIR29812) TaxID=667014 RepID=F8A8J9_THEID|nr:GDP-mannose 4,6-dehydratase [Thermodesulfatator indicus]AEH45085.1 NAD-dependent epimerase/dehydratase [Thermodesulfatator indicus DSM 15286]
MEAILITGGAGFIGSHLVDNLLARGEKVVVVDDFNDYYSPKIKWKNIEQALKNHNFHLEQGDIRDFPFLERVFKRYPIKCVVHLAARAGVRPSVEDPILYEEVNGVGTTNLLELARRFEVPKFVYGSSSSVYGYTDQVPFKEDACADQPVSPYAATKRANELMCHAYHHLFGLKVVCLRFFTVYGPRQRPEMAIHKFTRLIDEGKEIPVYGDGSSKRDYTYIDDIIQGVVAAIDKDFDYEIFNLGESQVTDLLTLIRLIEENLGKPAKIKFLPFQAGDVPITYADISKAKKILGYNPQVPIEEGIKRFISWYKKEARDI